MTIRLGTRGSALALAQARWVAAALEGAGEPVEVVTVRTEGDVSRASLASIGGTGVFAGALRRFLADGGCDLVVHSLKDLPVLPAPGLAIVAVPEREDARDVLCAGDGGTLATLSAGARVGTGSPRRRAQLLARRPDLQVVDLRGNIDTRLGAVRDGRLEAIVLSRAGLARLGLLGAVTEEMPLDVWPTAAGQGALAIEVRETDAAHLAPPFPAPGPIGAATAGLGDQASWDAVAAERAVLAGLEAGCVAPIGVASRVEPGGARIWASVHRPDGRDAVRGDRTVRLDPRDPSGRARAMHLAGLALAADLLARGAADMAPLGAA